MAGHGDGRGVEYFGEDIFGGKMENLVEGKRRKEKEKGKENEKRKIFSWKKK